ncbi:MAG: large conductance mechanosensitive channel protein MscL [Candidatus Izemoplasmatales bacterium]
MKKTIEEFKAFINKGNAIDLAVGIVIGGAFNAIIKSLVNDIIMPLISLVVSTDIKSLFWVLKGSATFDEVSGTTVFSEGAVIMYYGNFIQSVVDFLIIALSIFIALKMMVKIKEKALKIKSIIEDDLLKKENAE